MKTITNILTAFFFINIAFAGPFPGDGLPFPLPRCKVITAKYFVNSNFNGRGDGTLKAPFTSLAQALSAASMLDACSVELNVADGTYGENLNIDRKTTIVALSSKAVIAGSIANANGSFLKLNGIQINSATGFGIRQNGGRLEMNNSSILWTKPRGRNLDLINGTGLILTNAAKAILNTVQIAMNSNRGIYITDANSTIWANHLNVLRNGNSGIEVTRSAKAFLDDIRLEENKKANIFITENSKVNIKNALIMNSKFLTPNEWGSNIVILNNSVLDIYNFIVTGAEGTGVFFNNAFFTALLGQVDYNTVGIAFFNTTYQVSDCVGDNVTFTNNQTRIGGAMPLPSSCPVVDENCMKSKNCARVAWEMP